MSSFQNTYNSSMPGIPNAYRKPINIFTEHKRNSPLEWYPLDIGGY